MQLKRILEEKIGLTDAEWLAMEPTVSLFAAPAQTDIFKSGQHCSAIYFVERGAAYMHRKNTEGKKCVYLLATDGYFISDLECYLSKGMSDYTLTTLFSAQIYAIERGSVEALRAISPMKAQKLEQVMATMLFTSSKHRFEMLHYLQPAERFSLMLENNSLTIHDIDSRFLADYLGTTPHMVTRLRKRFEY